MKNLKLLLMLLGVFTIIVSCSNISPTSPGAGNNGDVDTTNNGGGITYASLYPKIRDFKHLDVIDKNDMSIAELQLIVSLQGALAQHKPSIYITDKTGGKYYGYWLQSMKDNSHITTTNFSNPWKLLKKYKDDISGYVLTKGGSVKGGWGTPETNAATSLAGINDAIVISEGIESKTKDVGLKEVADARNQTVDGVYIEHKDEFNNHVLITQPANLLELRDYAIATKAFVFGYRDNNGLNVNSLYSWLAPNSPQLGWTYAFKNKGEGEYIGDASKEGIFTSPSDRVLNLSTLAGDKEKSAKQKHAEATAKSVKTSSKAHYVSLVMSDGDNYSFVLKGLATNEKYFANSHRGDFAMNWTMPGSIIDLAPSVLQWYYKNASDKDYFVTGGSGAGYIFPSNYPNLDGYLSVFNKYLGREDMSYVGILDRPDIGSPSFKSVASKFAAESNIKGAFYVNYSKYNKGAGKIEFVNGKPFIAFRENLWFQQTNSDIINLANKINNQSTDPSKEGAYTIMNIHAWTENLDKVSTLVNHLDSDVKVVTLDKLFSQAKKNLYLEKSPTIDPQKVEYYLSNPKDIKVNISFNSAKKIKNIKYDGEKIGQKNYTVSNGKLTIGKDYISSTNPQSGDVQRYTIFYNNKDSNKLTVEIKNEVPKVTSLIPNFNFVDGFKGWTKTAGKADITISKEHAVSGGQSMLMNGSGFTTIYSPLGDAKPNTKYRFTAQIYADNDIQEGNIAIQFINADGAVTPLKGKNYMNYSRKGEGRFVKTDPLVVTSPADAVKVQVDIYTKNSKLWADNFVVQEVD